MQNKTTSLAKIETNRENAQKSTGPKDTSLTRLNALKHGILSKEALMVGEDKKVLEELGRRLRLELSPQSELENIFVDRIVSSSWRLKRAIGVERSYIQEEYEDSLTYESEKDKEKRNCKAWNSVVTRELGNSSTWLNLLRYETTIEKQIYKALHELMRLQSIRKGEKPTVPLAIDVDVSEGS